MVIFNESSTIGVVVVGVTSVTGNLFLSLLLIVFMLLIMALALRLDLEWSVILVYPLLLTLMSYDASFMPALGVFAIYTGIILSKNIFFR